MRYWVSSTVNDRPIVFQQPIPDPFVRHTVRVGLLDLLRGLLRGRLVVEVTVGGHREVMNRVLDLVSEPEATDPVPAVVPEPEPPRVPAVRMSDRVRQSDADVADYMLWMDSPYRHPAAIGVLTWLSQHGDEPVEIERMAVDFDESAKDILDAVRDLEERGLVDVERDEDDERTELMADFAPLAGERIGEEPR